MPTALRIDAVLRRSRTELAVSEFADALAAPLVVGIDRWAAWLLVALSRHQGRQEWVADMARKRLGIDFDRVGKVGPFGYPRELPARGLVPGLPEWEYALGGRNVTLTHRIDGTRVGVDLLEGMWDWIDPPLFTDLLLSQKRPEIPERLVRTLEPWEHAWMIDLPALMEADAIERSGARIRMSNDGRALCEAIAPLVDRLIELQDDAHPHTRRQAAYLAAALGDAVLATDQAGDALPATAQSVLRTAAEAERRDRSGLLRLGATSDDAENAAIALESLASLGREAAEAMIVAVLGDGRAPGGDSERAVKSVALATLDAWDDASLDDVVLSFTDRAGDDLDTGQRLLACRILARHLNTSGTARRDRLVHLLSTDFGPVEGEAGLLHAIVDPVAGVARLAEALFSRTPIVRAQSAAALGVIATEAARDALLAHLDSGWVVDEGIEARVALMEFPDAGIWRRVREWERSRHVAETVAPQREDVELAGELLSTYPLSTLRRHAIPDHIRRRVEVWRETYAALLRR
ncbi:MAG: hypothetical protein ACREIT_05475 [Tepidisphaeraceae bacterium]